jgi:hypothetical protein
MTLLTFLVRDSTSFVCVDLAGVNFTLGRSVIFSIPYLPRCGLIDTPRSWLPREVLLLHDSRHLCQALQIATVISNTFFQGKFGGESC